MAIQLAQKCVDIAWAAASAKLSANAGSAPNCLRMAFHDCQTFNNDADAGG